MDYEHPMKTLSNHMFWTNIGSSSQLKFGVPSAALSFSPHFVIMQKCGPGSYVHGFKLGLNLRVSPAKGHKLEASWFLKT